MQPKDEAELARMLATAMRYNGPAAIRYPRDPGPGVAVPDKPEPLEIGKAEIVEVMDRRCGTPPSSAMADGLPQTGGALSASPVSPGTNRMAWLWALGDMIPLARAAAAKLRATGVAAGVVNARFIKPLDAHLLAEQATAQTVFVALENGVVAGGFGSAVQEALAGLGRTNPVLRFGWPDEVIGQGTTASLMAAHGLTPEAVAARVLERLASGDGRAT